MSMTDSPLVLPEIQQAPEFHAQAVIDKTDLDLEAGRRGSGWIDGCVVTVTTPLSYAVQVAAGHVAIGGVSIPVVATNPLAMLPPNTTDRRDIVVVDATGHPYIKPGVPSTALNWSVASALLPPIKPIPDPNTVVLAEIYVPGNVPPPNINVNPGMIVDKRTPPVPFNSTGSIQGFIHDAGGAVFDVRNAAYGAVGDTLGYWNVPGLFVDGAMSNVNPNDPHLFTAATTAPFVPGDVGKVLGVTGANRRLTSADGHTRNATFNDGVSNGTTTYTSASANFSAIDVGATITGTNIPASTTIASVTNATTIVLSNAATGSGSALSFTIKSTRVSSASANFTASDVGKPILGTGIAALSVISSVIDSQTVTVSITASASSTNSVLTIGDLCLLTTIASYVSASQVMLTDPCLAPVSGQLWYYGHDDSVQIERARAAAAVAGGTVLLSPNPTVNGHTGAYHVTPARNVGTGATANGQTTVTAVNTVFRGSDVGQPIAGTGIPAGATIVGYNSSTSVVISAPATASNSGLVLTIGVQVNMGVRVCAGVNWRGSGLAGQVVMAGNVPEFSRIFSINNADGAALAVKNIWLDNLALYGNCGMQNEVQQSFQQQHAMFLQGSINCDVTRLISNGNYGDGVFAATSVGCRVAFCTFNDRNAFAPRNAAMRVGVNFDTASSSLCFGNYFEAVQNWAMKQEQDGGASPSSGNSYSNNRVIDCNGVLSLSGGFSGLTFADVSMTAGSAVISTNTGPWTGATVASRLVVGDGIPDGTTAVSAAGSSPWTLSLSQPCTKTQTTTVAVCNNSTELGIGDRYVTDGVTASGSKIVTSNTAIFTPLDVGRALRGVGVPTDALIVSVQSPVQATLTGAATASATGIRFDVFDTGNVFDMLVNNNNTNLTGAFGSPLHFNFSSVRGLGVRSNTIAGGNTWMTILRDCHGVLVDGNVGRGANVTTGSSSCIAIGGSSGQTWNSDVTISNNDFDFGGGGGKSGSAIGTNHSTGGAVMTNIRVHNNVLRNWSGGAAVTFAAATGSVTKNRIVGCGSYDVVADLIVTSGSTTVSTASYTFASSAVGKPIFGPGITPGTTIASQTGSTATLSAPATASSTGATLFIGSAAISIASASGSIGANVEVDDNELIGDGYIQTTGILINASAVMGLGINRNRIHGSPTSISGLTGNNIGGILNGYSGNYLTGGAGALPALPTGAQFYDGTTTSGSNALTSSTAKFTSQDVGASITGTGIPGGTTISSVSSGTQVVMSANATATATGVTFQLPGRTVMIPEGVGRWSGQGVPRNDYGIDGDTYTNHASTGVANTTIYQRRSGTYVGIV